MAQPKTVSLTLPTANTDGSAIAAGELVTVDVGYGTTSGSYPTIAEAALSAVDPTGTPTVTIPWDTLSQPVLAAGQWFFASRIKTDTGAVSAWSSEASFTVAVPVPNAPTGFTIA